MTFSWFHVISTFGKLAHAQIQYQIGGKSVIFSLLLNFFCGVVRTSAFDDIILSCL